MYNYRDEYRDATKDASVNTYNNRKTSNTKLILLNLFLASTLGLMAYVDFDSFSKQTTHVNKTNVMGASHTITDENLIGMLNDAKVDTLSNRTNGIQNAIDRVVSSSSGKEDTYIKLISQEILPTKKNKTFTIVVKKGDTLVSLAEEYYGDAKAYHKIIDANRNLTEKSNTIYVGQKINILY